MTLIKETLTLCLHKWNSNVIDDIMMNNIEQELKDVLIQIYIDFFAIPHDLTGTINVKIEIDEETGQMNFKMILGTFAQKYLDKIISPKIIKLLEREKKLRRVLREN